MGLRDADAKVQTAATKLLCAWYSEAGGDMLELLVQLDCENYTGKWTLQNVHPCIAPVGHAGPAAWCLNIIGQAASRAVTVCLPCPAAA